MSKKRDYSTWSKEELVREVEALKKQKTYGLVWEEDKTKEVFDYYMNWDGIKNKENFDKTQHKFPVLKEVKTKDITTAKDQPYNHLIEGDNYHSLAVLNFTHNKAIDVIYIDPPYNTGNKDFKYNDVWVDKEDAYRHSKWLSFMEKRLKLARTLLKESGVIFISIDDNELAQLRVLCDEIFNEKNFVANYIWEGRSGRDHTAVNVSVSHEYVICFSKNISKLNIKKDERVSSGGNYRDAKGAYRREQLRQWGTHDTRKDRPTMFYPLIAPDGSSILPMREDGKEGCWRVSASRMKEMIENGDVDFVLSDGKYKAYAKKRDGKITKTAYGTFLQGVGTSATGTIELKNIFGEKVFDTVKPTSLIKYLVNLINKKDLIVLDFFAGSGTTGHAVLELNKEDDGDRKFILCTNNEGDICTNVCYPRLEKVIKGYKTPEGNKVDGLGGNLKYLTTDFVDSSPTDKNKRKIVDKSTEMICLKENAFNLVKDKNNKYKIFKNSETHLGIIFDPDYIEDFIDEVKEIDGHINVYVFSLDDTVPEDEFKAIRHKINLCPIPEVILHVYRKVFKND
ncbi:MAG: site-specific DNA-methyltransferase [Candidatus Micrarchaeota archaeon]|nr:site-specific DNA-methyltransferase [Candidatus Micrarchaeota archaeon]